MNIFTVVITDLRIKRPHSNVEYELTLEFVIVTGDANRAMIRNLPQTNMTGLLVTKCLTITLDVAIKKLEIKQASKAKQSILKG